ncbi:Na+/H+ antiporter [Lichenibacterium minor]|uniref:Na+/H+ antiporter n=1 Tax=Lichenibacterium minor TaxID=2316528 RepID=A0A4Q2UDY9_9HYPH|nr:Na+/H+ antiporter [Lichenibacterium minor]RYC33025.1 Na+/H+ antiporter [Lichenibacterium minor]
MEFVEVLIGLLAASVALAYAARHARMPAAVALVLGGMALAFVPNVPRVELDPHIALAFFLPPLLQVSAYRTDWTAFRSALRPILLLALGAVVFTAAAVAAVTKWLAPELPWAACVALGAIVAPPDAVAASAVLKTTRIPRRLVTILEGESLLNDASSLILYRAAIAATAAGSVSFGEAGSSFVLSALGGTAIGYAVGRLAIMATMALEDTLLEISAGVLAGFAGYFGAEAFGLSGVLAAVACGLVTGVRQHEVLSARTRVAATAVWDFIEFVLTSLVFILIGLQLRDVVGRLGAFGFRDLAVLALATSAALIASRFVWVYGTSGIPRALGFKRATLRPSHLAVISWAGMRGVVSLAAALALPVEFPGRDLIIFLAFCAILVTLVLQGTTLGWVIRRLGVVEGPAEEGVSPEARVRHEAAAAALRTIEHRLYNGRVLGLPDADMLRHYRQQRDNAEAMIAGHGLAAKRREARLQLELSAAHAARRAVLDRAGTIDGELLQSLEEEFDFDEGRLRRALGGDENRG